MSRSGLESGSTRDASIARRALADARRRRASRRASRPSASCSRTCCARSGRTSRCCSSTRSITSPQTLRLSRRAGGAVEAEPGQPARGGAAASGCGRRSTEACCARHKVEPLFSALEGYDIWFTALRREQSPSRANLQEVEPFRLPSGKIDLARQPAGRAGRRSDVWTYAKAHDIPLLPLYELGYTSIGCEPCTALPLDPDNPRSGRWQGQKLECGIHIQAK